ncbi:MAG: alpha amylase C-terminal domain-containing protein [Phycisphaerae bacterium]|nr:alpha amylase C-terminal domain-containing protein [Phycisphaerae bacterium]
MTLHLSLFTLALALPSAANDNNVEWTGVTHVDWLDRTPRCPVDGESFTVSFQTYRYDITDAWARVWTGSESWHQANWSHHNGGYDVWTVTIPASSSTGTLEYYIQVIDGVDIDYLGPYGMSDDAPADGWFLDFATTSHTPLGATLTSDGGAVFKVWAPSPSTANVAGQFNGWSSSADPMTKSGEYFTGRVGPPVSAGDQYKYVFNGSHWAPDARARALNPGDNNNSYIIDPDAYVWGDQEYYPPPFEEMILYELHVGTFSGYNDGLNGMGTYRDVVDTHLDHLLYLGITAVELMPITEFDYHESWGYNPVNNWGPEEAYGSPDDLRYMIDVLHQNGIAVILDVVYNHLSYNGNYLWWYDGSQIYFDDPACDTPWGSQMAFWKQPVQEYYEQNILYWLHEFHADGFRMDATTYMREPLGCYPAGWDIMTNINNSMNARAADRISIAEELPDNGWSTAPTGAGGAGFDSQWHDRYKYAVRQAIFDGAYGDPYVQEVKDVLSGRLNDDTSSYIQNWGQSTTQLVNYVETHDEAGDESGGQRFAVSIDSGDHYSYWAKGRSKLAQGLTILAPGIPIFLQGGEWMEDIQFGSGWHNRIDWQKAADRGPIVQFFRDVIAVRKGNGGFRSDAGVNVYHCNESGNVLAFHRWDGGGNDIVVVANFSSNNYYDYHLGFPHGGTWYELLNSESGIYDGNNEGNGGSIETSHVYKDGYNDSAWITIPHMGLLVFRFNDPPNPPGNGDFDYDGDTDLRDFATFQACYGGGSCPGFADIDLDRDGDVALADYQVFYNNFSGPN